MVRTADGVLWCLPAAAAPAAATGTGTTTVTTTATSSTSTSTSNSSGGSRLDCSSDCGINFWEFLYVPSLCSLSLSLRLYCRLEAQVIKVEERIEGVLSVKVHYKGWKSKYNEWIVERSSRCVLQLPSPCM